MIIISEILKRDFLLISQIQQKCRYIIRSTHLSNNGITQSLVLTSANCSSRSSSVFIIYIYNKALVFQVFAILMQSASIF
jgi:hypothetical protein